jgi:hypothetical protein
MDVLPPIVAIAVPVGLFSAVGLALWMHHKRIQEARVRTFAAVGHSLGLAARPDAVWGLLHGVSVSAHVEMRGGKNKRAYTVTSARLVPALDLGLVLRSQMAVIGGLEAFFLGLTDHKLGDPAFDDAFIVHADEAARVHALLHPHTRSVLLRAASAATVNVTDLEVVIEEAGEPREAFLQWALATGAQLAILIGHARARVPVAASLLPLLRGYQEAARRLGLSWMTTPLAVSGNIDGVEVYSHALRTNKGAFGAQVIAVFPSPLGLGLSIRPKKDFSLLSRLGGLEDVEVGHARFDDAFIVRAGDKARLARALNDEVRAALFAITEAGSIEVSDTMLAVRLPYLPEPRAVPDFIARVSTLAKTMHHRATGEEDARGPYR